MPKVTPELEERLRKCGYWREFNLRRRQLNRNEFEAHPGGRDSMSRDQRSAAAQRSWRKVLDEYLPLMDAFEARAAAGIQVSPTGTEVMAPDSDAAWYHDAELQTRGKKASDSDVYRWVWRHVDLSLKSILPSTVPCPEAVSLLKWVRSSKKNRDAFMKDNVIPMARKAASEAPVVEAVETPEDLATDEILREFRKAHDK